MTTTEAPLIDQLKELAEADTHVLVGKIVEHALLVDLTVRRWEGRHQIEGAEVTLGGKPLPKKLTSKSHWILMPAAWNDRFNQMANILRGFLQPRVQPVRGIDVISLKDAPKIFKKIREYREETWDPSVDEFVAAWPAIAAQLHPDLVKHFLDQELSEDDAKLAADAVYRQLAKHVPTQAAMRSKFGVLMPIIPLGDQSLNPAALLEGNEAEAFLQELERGTKNFVNSVFLGIIEQPLEEAAAVAASIVAKAKEGKGGLREESMGVMRRALEKLKSFSDFVARPALLSAIAKAEHQLDSYNHEELNEALRKKTIVAEALSEAFQSIGDEVHAAEAQVRKYGRKFRAIDL